MVRCKGFALDNRFLLAVFDPDTYLDHAKGDNQGDNENGGNEQSRLLDWVHCHGRADRLNNWA